MPETEMVPASERRYRESWNQRLERQSKGPKEVEGTGEEVRSQGPSSIEE